MIIALLRFAIMQLQIQTVACHYAHCALLHTLLKDLKLSASALHVDMSAVRSLKGMFDICSIFIFLNGKMKNGSQRNVVH